VDDGGDARYSVGTYLAHQGRKLVERFDANCYVKLTLSMDTHDVARGRGEYFDVLASISQPALAIGIDTDILYPVDEQRELAEHMPNARLAVLESRHGPEAFLIEADAVNDIVAQWRRESLERRALSNWSQARSPRKVVSDALLPEIRVRHPSFGNWCQTTYFGKLVPAADFLGAAEQHAEP